MQRWVHGSAGVVMLVLVALVGDGQTVSANDCRRACKSGEANDTTTGCCKKSEKPAPLEEGYVNRRHREACEAGDAAACVKLSAALASSAQTVSYRDRAIALSTAGCKRNGGKACYVLWLLTDESPDRDALLLRSCLASHPPACATRARRSKDATRKADLKALAERQHRKRCARRDVESCALLHRSARPGADEQRARTDLGAALAAACSDESALRCLAVADLYASIGKPAMAARILVPACRTSGHECDVASHAQERVARTKKAKAVVVELQRRSCIVGEDCNHLCEISATECESRCAAGNFLACNVLGNSSKQGSSQWTTYRERACKLGSQSDCRDLCRVTRKHCD